MPTFGEPYNLINPGNSNENDILGWAKKVRDGSMNEETFSERVERLQIKKSEDS